MERSDVDFVERSLLLKLRKGSDVAVIGDGPASCPQAIGPGSLYPFASADSGAAPRESTCGAVEDLPG